MPLVIPDELMPDPDSLIRELVNRAAHETQQGYGDKAQELFAHSPHSDDDIARVMRQMVIDQAPRDTPEQRLVAQISYAVDAVAQAMASDPENAEAIRAGALTEAGALLDEKVAAMADAADSDSKVG